MKIYYLRDNAYHNYHQKHNNIWEKIATCTKLKTSFAVRIACWFRFDRKVGDGVAVCRRTETGRVVTGKWATDLVRIDITGQACANNRLRFDRFVRCSISTVAFHHAVDIRLQIWWTWTRCWPGPGMLYAPFGICSFLYFIYHKIMAKNVNNTHG